MKTLILALATFTLTAAQSRPVCSVPVFDEETVSTFHLDYRIINPARYQTDKDPKNDDAAVEPDFDEGYGILFEADAVGAGPICVERENVLPLRRCISLETLRRIIWESQQ